MYRKSRAQSQGSGRRIKRARFTFTKTLDEFEYNRLEHVPESLIDRVTFRSHILNMNVKEFHRQKQTYSDGAKPKND